MLDRGHAPEQQLELPFAERRGGDPEAGRRGTETQHSDGTRPVRAAGGAAGAAADVGANLGGTSTGGTPTVALRKRRRASRSWTPGSAVGGAATCGSSGVGVNTGNCAGVG
jgi:hypothetical protein